MKIIIAPQGFKGCLNATDVSRAIRDGVLRADPTCEVVLCPLADGGEGTLDLFLGRGGFAVQERTVRGPLGLPVRARWAISTDGATAVIETAEAAGLQLVPAARRDVRRTSTIGVGELIEAALARHPRTILVGLGGSATNDGGAGMAQALGVRFFDCDGLIREPITGGALSRITRLDPGSVRAKCAGTEVIGACDVDNPLYGPDGAAHGYAAQKGASVDVIEELDAGLRRLAALVGSAGRLAGAVESDCPNRAGAGAAGGLGFGLAAFLGAELRSGVQILLDQAGFGDLVRGADLVLTGEGRLDAQTRHGKTCVGVAVAAAERGVPTVALAGAVELRAGEPIPEPLAACVSLRDEPLTPAEAMEEGRTRRLLAKAAEQVVRRYAAGEGLGSL